MADNKCTIDDDKRKLKTPAACVLYACAFLQRVSLACYAERCTSYSKSVRLSVCLSRKAVVYSLDVHVQQMRCSVKCTIIERAEKDVRS